MVREGTSLKSKSRRPNNESIYLLVADIWTQGAQTRSICRFVQIPNTFLVLLCLFGRSGNRKTLLEDLLILVTVKMA